MPNWMFTEGGSTVSGADPRAGNVAQQSTAQSYLYVSVGPHTNTISSHSPVTRVTDITCCIFASYVAAFMWLFTENRAAILHGPDGHVW